MNIWHDIAKERIQKDDFIGVIEISKGGKNKYELDKETGMLKLDRVLYTSTHYPANYGFIPRTYAGDNDPLDVLVLCQEEIVPMTLVETYPIGVLIMTDDNEEVEFYIIEETRVNGYNYILVTDSQDEDDEEAEAYILKDVSDSADPEAAYEFVEDDEELEGVSKIFAELLEDIDIE